MGVILSAGGSLRWFKDNVSGLEAKLEELSGISSYETLTREAQKVSPGSEGLIFLPYLMGERTPWKDANAKGLFFGITGRHTRSHLIRSVLEGITFAMKDSMEIIKEQGIDIKEVRATGGGAASSLWLQLQSDIYNVPVTTVNTSKEGPGFGAALMAGVSSGLWSDLLEATEKVVKVNTTTEPIEKNTEIYDRFYAVYRSLYPSLREGFSKVAKAVKDVSEK